MRIRHSTYKILTILCSCLALLLFAISMIGGSPDRDSRRVAERVGNRTERRLAKLDGYILQASETDGDRLIYIDNLPEDMVIYRYRNDSLQSWCNQFSVINDDISAKLVFKRLSDLKSRIISPLSEVSKDLTYMNIGPKWYLVKSQTDGNGTRIIAGLEIFNTLTSDTKHTASGVNPALKLPGRYSVTPLNNNGGTPVIINGRPLFKVTYDTIQAYTFFNNSALLWISLILLAFATVFFLAEHRSLKVYYAVLFLLLIILAGALAEGRKMSDTISIFSPTLYADNTVFYSLGSLLLINTYITLSNICTYLVRKRTRTLIRRNRKTEKRNLAIYGGIILLLAAGTFVYTHISLKSLMLNSTITMELYRWNTTVTYTIVSYLSFTGIFLSILLLLQSIRPSAQALFGIKYNIFNRKTLILSAFLWALYITVTSGVLGFKKEQDRVMVWSNRLAVDRDLSMEIQLRSVEDEIASDQVIATLAEMDNGPVMIQNRISEYYLGRLRQNYSIKVFIVSQENQSTIAHFEQALQNGVPITDGSRFLFITENNGRSVYTGIFLFYSEKRGIIQLLVEIEPDSNKEDQGYSTILGRLSGPGKVNLPPMYSYAKYTGRRLTSYKGNYPYPTLIDYIYDTGNDRQHVVRKQGYIHFMRAISPQEIIMISRPVKTVMVYFTSLSYFTLAVAAILQFFARGRRKKNFRFNYFRNKINTILFLSSILIMISMSVISVLFVYKRNEVNMFNLMSSKISTMQALIMDQAKQADDWKHLTSPEFALELERISNTTKSDISLYTPAGKVFRSTTPEAFEKMILGSRIDQEAYYNICYLHQRFYIQSENIAGSKMWTLYAPVFNDDGDMIAIISTPYTDRNFDFKREAQFHAAMIINLFILLLISSLLFSSREVNALFAPLIVMGKKMASTSINNLETITYKRDDEISSLVEAYNRMVRDLSDSTRQLAQAERDNAWSQMARQVAHEIKNPLTPIKLELQRLIRLKQNNNPTWEEKFDKVSSVILEHIDILTDTANEFSTFAKLYSEDPTLINLDKVLKDQMLIFDNKEHIRMSYLGMENADVMAPKPQLIRVFVNLITNAIQAVEILKKEYEERGEDFIGKIVISLRHSTEDGFYDVVVEDNGPGVKEENLNKLFTPNFTTKSGGTGLGLAICRSIVMKCNGKISYKKSFSLGGASFIVTLPKYVG